MHTTENRPILACRSAVPDQVLVDEARKAFAGEIIAGRDLLVLYPCSCGSEREEQLNVSKGVPLPH